MLSLGIDCALAALTAARRRGFMSGSGMPIFAATVISRLSFEKAAERFLSCAPLRCMMFLNLEWPAIAGSSDHAERIAIGFHQRVGFVTVVLLHLPQADDAAHRLGIEAGRLGFVVDVADVVG